MTGNSKTEKPYVSNAKRKRSQKARTPTQSRQLLLLSEAVCDQNTGKLTWTGTI